MTVRSLAHAVLALLLAAALAPVAAQGFPSRPIRIVVPFTPAGGVDTLTRIMGQRLGENLGVTMLIDNRPGGGGTIGADAVARAPADGYTLLTSAPEFAINAVIRGKPPYDAIRDFTHISMIASGSFILASHPSVPVKTARDIIAMAKTKPNQFNYGSSGAGGINHMSGELFRIMSGIQWVHIPFKGSGPSTAALMAGEVDFVFGSASSMISAIQAGKIKPIGITGSRRYSELPDVPTLAESGLPGYDVLGWYGFYGPASLPATVLKRLHADTVRALNSPDVREKLARTGIEVVASSPDEFTAFLRRELDKWAKVVKAANLRAE